mmetsp:Transcript_20652/g.55270  ORF Transcript_20652/g.55270 Transcript_20652/m.55270 type:complete len:350 (+) Transcript_20652:1026-2075(+)
MPCRRPPSRVRLLRVCPAGVCPPVLLRGEVHRGRAVLRRAGVRAAIRPPGQRVMLQRGVPKQPNELDGTQRPGLREPQRDVGQQGRPGHDHEQVQEWRLQLGGQQVLPARLLGGGRRLPRRRLLGGRVRGARGLRGGLRPRRCGGLLCNPGSEPVPGEGGRGVRAEGGPSVDPAGLFGLGAGARRRGHQRPHGRPPAEPLPRELDRPRPRPRGRVQRHGGGRRRVRHDAVQRRRARLPQGRRVRAPAGRRLRPALQRRRQGLGVVPPRRGHRLRGRRALLQERAERRARGVGHLPQPACLRCPGAAEGGRPAAGAGGEGGDRQPAGPPVSPSKYSRVHQQEADPALRHL